MLAAVAGNNDFEWLVHFLSDFGYLYWGMRTAIRGNDGDYIDLVWRECVSFMNTELSNKNNYAPLALMRTFWSAALNPLLARVLKRNRTISLIGMRGSNTVYDMITEKENWMVAANVVRPSFEAVEKYVSQLNVTGYVNRFKNRALLEFRNQAPYKRRMLKEDVDAMVQRLESILGDTWKTAVLPIRQQESKLVHPPRSRCPWSDPNFITFEA